jgi:hypothetical protein
MIKILFFNFLFLTLPLLNVLAQKSTLANLKPFGGLGNDDLYSAGFTNSGILNVGGVRANNTLALVQYDKQLNELGSVDLIKPASDNSQLLNFKYAFDSKGNMAFYALVYDNFLSQNQKVGSPFKFTVILGMVKANGSFGFIREISDRGFTAYGPNDLFFNGKKIYLSVSYGLFYEALNKNFIFSEDGKYLAEATYKTKDEAFYSGAFNSRGQQSVLSFIFKENEISGIYNKLTASVYPKRTQLPLEKVISTLPRGYRIEPIAGKISSSRFDSKYLVVEAERYNCENVANTCLKGNTLNLPKLGIDLVKFDSSGDTSWRSSIVGNELSFIDSAVDENEIFTVLFRANSRFILGKTDIEPETGKNNIYSATFDCNGKLLEIKQVRLPQRVQFIHGLGVNSRGRKVILGSFFGPSNEDSQGFIAEYK